MNPTMNYRPTSLADSAQVKVPILFNICASIIVTKTKCSQILMQTHRKVLIIPSVRAWKTLYYAHEYHQDQSKQCQNIFILVKKLTALNTKKLPNLSSHLSNL